MKIPVTEQTKIPDGLHKGAVTSVEYRTTPYNYTDLVISFMHEEKQISLKCGYPTSVGEGTKLGQLLIRFGVKLEVGAEIDPDIMIGKKVQFMTMNEKKEKNEYARILPDSVKPL